MTKYVIIKKVSVPGGYCIQDEGNDTGLFILGMFLYSEITSVLFYDYFTSWLKGEMDQNEAYGDSYMLVEHNEKITILHQRPIKGKNLSFITTKNELLEIIDDWLRTILRKPEPFEVMIMQNEAGKVNFKWLGKSEEIEKVTS